MIFGLVLRVVLAEEISIKRDFGWDFLGFNQHIPALFTYLCSGKGFSWSVNGNLAIRLAVHPVNR
jgi:hypothetical protein